MDPRLPGAHRRAAAPLLVAFATICAIVDDAAAYTVTINTGPKAAYLRVGDGSITGGNYSAGGTPAANPTVNQVSVNVPAAVVGDGSDQIMSGNGRLTSDLDGFVFCNAGEIYIGAFFRLPNTQNQSATLRATAPATLVNASGDAIPIAQISWTSSGIGDGAAVQPFPAGSFSGGTQTLATLQRNLWAESCHRFRYGNDAIVPAGTYAARVTYTLSTP